MMVIVVGFWVVILILFGVETRSSFSIIVISWHVDWSLLLVVVIFCDLEGCRWDIDVSEWVSRMYVSSLVGVRPTFSDAFGTSRRRTSSVLEMSLSVKWVGVSSGIFWRLLPIAVSSKFSPKLSSVDPYVAFDCIGMLLMDFATMALLWKCPNSWCIEHLCLLVWTKCWVIPAGEVMFSFLCWSMVSSAVMVFTIWLSS